MCRKIVLLFPFPIFRVLLCFFFILSVTICVFFSTSSIMTSYETTAIHNWYAKSTFPMNSTFQEIGLQISTSIICGLKKTHTKLQKHFTDLCVDLFFRGPFARSIISIWSIRWRNISTIVRRKIAAFTDSVTIFIKNPNVVYAWWCFSAFQCHRNGIFKSRFCR